VNQIDAAVCCCLIESPRDNRRANIEQFDPQLVIPGRENYRAERSYPAVMMKHPRNLRELFALLARRVSPKPLCLDYSKPPQLNM
jgi:hypothetical protein